MKHNYVPDGCFLLARMIFDSAIWRDDPHVLKLFIYLVGKARYKTTPKKYPAFEVKHGELVTSLSQMAEDNEFLQQKAVRRWSRAKVSRMLNTLQDQGYVTLIADTYGTHISICNYSLYQDLNNYKADNNETVAKQPCNGSETVPGIYKKGNKGEKGKKENNKPTWDFPEGLNMPAWIDYESFRQAMPKKDRLTDKAKELASKKLSKSSDEDQREMVDNSIMNGWKGLYELKPKDNKAPEDKFKGML